VVTKEQFLLDLEAYEAEPIVYELPSTYKEPELVCHCSVEDHACKSLHGSSEWFLLNFGCELARCYSNHFDLQQDNLGPYFELYGCRVTQTRPLPIKELDVNRDVVRFIDKCEELSTYLQSKWYIPDSRFKDQFRRIHEMLRLELKHLKENGTRSMLERYVYKLCPDSQAKHSLLPKI